MWTEWVIQGPTELELDNWRSLGLRLRIHRLDNGSFVVSVMEHFPIDPMYNFTSDNLTSVNSTGQMKPYDHSGALYYVVAVVFIYGFSIILMIGSLIRRSQHDRGMTTYMKDMDKVRRLERRQEKFKVRLFMQHKKVHKILGPDRAIIELPENKGQTKSDSRSPKTSVSSSLWSTTSNRDEEDVGTNYPLLQPPLDNSIDSSPVSPCPSYNLSIPEEPSDLRDEDETDPIPLEAPQVNKSTHFETFARDSFKQDDCGSTLSHQQQIALCTLLEEEEEVTLL